MEKYDEAINDYDSAIKIDPDNYVFYIGRSEAKISKGDTAGALKDLQSAEKIDSLNISIYNAYANYYRRIQEFEKAFHSLSKAIEINEKEVKLIEYPNFVQKLIYNKNDIYLIHITYIYTHTHTHTHTKSISAKVMSLFKSFKCGIRREVTKALFGMLVQIGTNIHTLAHVTNHGQHVVDLVLFCYYMLSSIRGRRRAHEVPVCRKKEKWQGLACSVRIETFTYYLKPSQENKHDHTARRHEGRDCLTTSNHSVHGTRMWAY
jgi:tetratricopeptide (TPR) repeat protein